MSSSQEAPWQRAWEEVRCSISIASDTVTAAEITTLLGAEPTRQRIKNEPISPKRPNIPVASHLWTWQPDDSVERSLDAQLDAIWAEHGARAELFRTLPAEASVRLAIWITHCGDDLRLGWALDRRHVSHAAAFGASLDIDEYDDTE
jgi:hypothetical protein